MTRPSSLASSRPQSCEPPTIAQTVHIDNRARFCRVRAGEYRYFDGAVIVDPFDPSLLAPGMHGRALPQTSGPDPNPILDLFYGCGSSVNWDGYCNHDVDKLIEQQSMEGDPDRRKQIWWQIERKLAEEDARPIIFYADGGTCMRPWVKGQVVLVNSIFNGARREDVWLDK